MEEKKSDNDIIFQCMIGCPARFFITEEAAFDHALEEHGIDMRNHNREYRFTKTVNPDGSTIIVQTRDELDRLREDYWKKCRETRVPNNQDVEMESQDSSGREPDLLSQLTSCLSISDGTDANVVQVQSSTIEPEHSPEKMTQIQEIGSPKSKETTTDEGNEQPKDLNMQVVEMETVVVDSDNTDNSRYF